MIEIGFAQIEAVAIWSSINIALMMVLLLNVFRFRVKEKVAVGTGVDAPKLERAIRAHGNNTENVPAILLGMVLLAFLGEAVLTLHVLGALLFVGRILHAYGIQDMSAPVPMARVVGNLVSWGIIVFVIGRLLYLAI